MPTWSCASAKTQDKRHRQAGLLTEPRKTLSHSAVQHILVKIIVGNADAQKGFVRCVVCFFTDREKVPHKVK